MDNLCHTLAGAALGQAGLKHRTSLGMATLLIGANLPDVDVLAIPFGHSIDFRRGWTHGVLALVVLPLLLTGAMLAWDRWIRRRRHPAAAPANPRALLLLASLAILSHPALDWLNTYGLRWLMPFSGRWFYGDALFIVDLWVWLALGAGVLLSSRRHRAGRSAPARPARLAVAAVAAYMAVMVAGSALAERWVMRRLPALGIDDARSVLASPVWLNPLRREVVIETPSSYRFGDLSLGVRPGLRLRTASLPRADSLALVLARRDALGRRFLVWSRYPVATVEARRAGLRIRLDDARYARPGRPSWAGVSAWVPHAAR